MLFLFDCIAQKIMRKKVNFSPKATTTQKKGSTTQRSATGSKTQVDEEAEINVKGHIDFLLPDDNEAESKMYPPLR